MTQIPVPVHTTELFESWMAVEKAAPGLLSPIATQAQHERALHVIDELIMMIGNEPVHPLLSLLTLLANHVEAFEKTTYPIARVSPDRVLSFLMAQRGLTLKQLEADTGIDQRNLSKILKGVRALSVPQIKTLSTYFHVSAAVFIF